MPQSTPTDAPIAVDIVVPIYNAYRDVQLCVESILRHTTGDWRLTLVDDASTEKELASFLKDTARTHAAVTLLRNTRNAGFVVSANRGLRHAEGRDVILLNSDTVVTTGFVGKLIGCANADDRTGIVSPFTNNGTICSIPEFGRDNELPTDMSIDAYGRFISEISLLRRPELVTAVGFCMYIRAEVLSRIGYFDEEHFGRGFGEENDFCERAKAAGYTVRLCDDLFIAHTGKSSFREEGRELERAHSKILDRLHPRYFADVAEFCHRNPLRELHENIKYHLARRQGRQCPAMLFLLHASIFTETMGGTEHLVRDLIENLALPRALVAFPDGDSIAMAEVFDGRVSEAIHYRFDAGCVRPFFERRNPATEAALGRIIDRFNVGAAHIHHLIRWPIGVWRVLEERGIPYVYTIHDYYCVCPSWNHCNRDTGQPCACRTGDRPATQACIAAQHTALNLPPPSDATALLHEHRAEFGALLGRAQSLYAPSEAAYRVVQERYDKLPDSIRVIGHGYDLPEKQAATPAATEAGANTAQDPDSASLRVAILGQVAYPAKGAEAYLELMGQTRTMPVQWHVFGDVEVYRYRRRLEQLHLGGRLRLHGAYRREQIFDLLTAHAIDVSLILPACDETFCFTLSESWLAGVPAIVSDRGALPERVRESEAGVVVGSTREALDTLCNLSADRAALDPLRAKAERFRHVTRRDNAELHKAAYGDLWQRVTARCAEPAIRTEERELFEVYDNTRNAEAASQAPPRPSYHESWWYPHYLRFRPCVPPSFRGWAKRMYLRARP